MHGLYANPILALLTCLLLNLSADAKEAVFTNRIAFDASDGAQTILANAASVVPSRAQLLHHQDEFIGFVHFGPNTYSGVEWGNGKESPEIFNPGDTLDTNQWCRIMKAAGMTKVLITVKHHDGFCIWQTRYNDAFSVRAIPWRNGQGDVLQELSDSCLKYGLKLGVYLSPADLYQIESPTGHYGNLSKYQKTVIPTDVASFKTDPTQLRTDKPEEAPTFSVEVDDYNRYFMNQLYELLTEYGPIHEVWFDGAHPKRKGGQKYAQSEWFTMIRKLAPEAVIFGGPDVRWCGNEGGFTRESEWNVLPVTDKFGSCGDPTEKDMGSDNKLLALIHQDKSKTFHPKYLNYLISEVDTSIRAGWFWSKHQAVRTVDDVLDIYERTVGGNATFLLNVPPNKLGLISPRDEACLLELGRRLKATYSKNLIHVKCPQGHIGRTVTDGDLESYWQPEGNSGSFEVLLQQPQTITRFVLQEAIATVGQRVKKHAIDVWQNGEWREIATATTIGYKRILRFPEVTTDRFRVRVLQSREKPTIAEIGAYFYYQPLPPVVVNRDADGVVTLSLGMSSQTFAWKQQTDQYAVPVETDSVEIRYTLDASEPTIDSSLYLKPFDLPEGGFLRARSIAQQHRNVELGVIAEVRFGISPVGWELRDVSNTADTEHGAEKAIDGNAATYWQTAGQLKHPHQLTIDLGQEFDVAGITYLPRQDKHLPDGMVESGQIEVSCNGQTWQQAGTFHFGNLLNDPTTRSYLFKKSHLTRYVRFISEAGVKGKPNAGAAEIGILKER